MPNSYPLLDSIQLPRDLKQLDESQLEPLAGELRDYLLRTVARCGGHLGAGLGTVELSIALHYVYDTPDDRIVWDVGHQSYPHKILTGRKSQLATIRQKNGLAPFPKRDESPYDTFGVGHAGTSISAALGMAIGCKGSSRKVVAVIGDGAMTSGMAYEALNHAGDLRSDMLVILNDNEMSISQNVGALTTYLARCVSSPLYSTLREGGKKVLAKLPPIAEFARRAEEHVKGMMAPGTFFEELGFHYFGPVDGHDLPTLIQMLRNLRQLDGPRLLHVVTKKGKGYAPAEADQIKYHGVSPFDPELGIQKKAGSAKPTYTDVFSDWLCDMAAQDSRLIGITPAMREGSGLVKFSKEYPERYVDVGIAEQHCVTIAAGMACEGLKPVVAIYSTFLQRAYDQVIHDIAVQDLPVLLAIDRAGVVGPDGPTHTGSYDFSYLRCIPNVAIMAPADENECRQMLYTGFQMNQCVAVRYPRGTGPGVAVQKEMQALPIGKGETRRRGRDVAILAFGAMVAPAAAVAEALDATLVNMRWVKPVDRELVLEMAASHRVLVTIEDNVIMGGAGSAVTECLAEAGVLAPVLHLGLPDRNIEHAAREEMLTEAGLDPAGIQASIEAYVAKLAANASHAHTDGAASVPVMRLAPAGGARPLRSLSGS